jgi:hypothetical protein
MRMGTNLFVVITLLLSAASMQAEEKAAPKEPAAEKPATKEAAPKKAAPKKVAAKKGASAAEKKAAQAKATAEKAAGAFVAFCQEWMGKLAVRERDNKKQIKWKTAAGGSQGEYVGYSQEHTCQVKEQTEPTSVPIGTITYRELRYQKNGPTEAEAANSEPRVVEIVEVIEIFRFTGGKWVY